MSSQLPSPEALQSVILDAIHSAPSGSIPDTRILEYNGISLGSGDGQAVVKSALDSLASKEVKDFFCSLMSQAEDDVGSASKTLLMSCRC